MFQTSEKTDLIDAAIAAAQGQILPAVKDASNPHFRSKYADLAGVMEVARPHLSANGVSVQTALVTDVDKKLVGCTVRIGHKSGQWIVLPTVYCQLKGIGPQDVGTAATYLRRYSICAALNIVTDDDDDGETASGRGRHLANDKPTPPPPPAPVPEFEAPMVKARSASELPIDQRVAIMVGRFQTLGISAEEIEAEVGCPLNKFEPIHLEIALDFYNGCLKSRKVLK